MFKLSLIFAPRWFNLLDLYISEVPPNKTFLSAKVFPENPSLNFSSVLLSSLTKTPDANFTQAVLEFRYVS